MRLGEIQHDNIMPINSSNHNTNNIGFNGSKPIILKLDALYSTGNPVTGESASIYYDESYTEENPIMVVKGQRSDGSTYEQKVNVKDVETGKASYIEMIALTTYLSEQGKLSSPDLGINTNQCTNNDMFTKQDFMTPLKQMMQWQLENRNMDGYAYFADRLKILQSWNKTLPLYNKINRQIQEQ